MLVLDNMTWDREADVIVVGCGLAGAVAAITAHDAGVKVIVLEKQPAGTHVSSSSMSSGAFVCPTDIAGAVTYMKAVSRAQGDMDWTPPDIIEALAKYAVENKDWMEKLGGKIRFMKKGAEHPELPGADSIAMWGYRGMGITMMKFMYEQLRSRGIEVMHETPAKELITNTGGEVIGVAAGDRPVNVRALRGVVLSCGGFEHNEEMKLQYLKVYPSYFDACLANTGDGVKMAQKVGADLWHMNCVSARFVSKFPDNPYAFKMDYGGSHWVLRQYGIKNPVDDESSADEKPRPVGFIIVDKYGRRYTSENFKSHCVYYETTSFDSQRLEFPRVPSYFIFDRRRMEAGPLPQTHSGPAGPHQLYRWSRDNQAELKKGWIVTGQTAGELARKLGMSHGILANTVRAWNRYCENGKDIAFGRKTEELVPLDSPPYCAVRLFPGGPNTQGGPRRNRYAQIVNPDGVPIPGL